MGLTLRLASSMRPVAASPGAAGLSIATPSSATTTTALTNVSVAFPSAPGIQVDFTSQPVTQTTCASGKLAIVSGCPEIDLSISPSSGVTLGATITLEAQSGTGFGASTGGSMNNHEIQNVVVSSY